MGHEVFEAFFTIAFFGNLFDRFESKRRRCRAQYAFYGCKASRGIFLCCIRLRIDRLFGCRLFDILLFWLLFFSVGCAGWRFVQRLLILFGFRNTTGMLAILNTCKRFITIDATENGVSTAAKVRI